MIYDLKKEMNQQFLLLITYRKTISLTNYKTEQHQTFLRSKTVLHFRYITIFIRFFIIMDHPRNNTTWICVAAHLCNLIYTNSGSFQMKWYSQRSGHFQGINFPQAPDKYAADYHLKLKYGIHNIIYNRTHLHVCLRTEYNIACAPSLLLCNKIKFQYKDHTK